MSKVFTTFNQNKFDFMAQPMFFGESVNVARFDQQRHNKFEKLTEKQLAFFWRPEEVDLVSDAAQFKALPDHEQHIFTQNLKYQTLLDSIQGRGPNVVLLPICSDPALENWIETWSFSETIHARSYQHILKNVYPNPTLVLDEIMTTPEILQRAESVTSLYDELNVLNMKRNLGLVVDEYEHAKRLYLCMHSINILEAIRFYVSFACSFAFAERGLMEGNAGVIKLIARDEALHLSGTQYILREMQNGGEGPLMAKVAKDCEEEAGKLFLDAAQQEKDWATFLFQHGAMLGLNAEILGDYVDYITDQRMRAAGLPSIIEKTLKNPIPWINKWLSSSNVQISPQEKETLQYLSGQVNTNIGDEDFDMDL